MSTEPHSKTDPELATSYAALILADEGLDITADKLQLLLKVAGIEDVEGIWTTLFAEVLEGRDVKELLTEIGTPGVVGQGSKGGDGMDGGEEKVEEKVEENGGEDGGEGDGEDSDGDLGLDIFGL